MNNKELKILVNYTGRRGGGALYSYEMSKALIDKNIQVYGIVSSNLENLNEWKNLKFKQLIVIKTYSTFLQYIFYTLKFILIGHKEIKILSKNINFDYVYVPMIQPWTLLINRYFAKSKKIVTLHDPKPHTGSNKIFNVIIKKNIEKATKVIILSESFRNYTSTHYKVPDANILTIPHGIFDYYKKFNDTSMVEYYEKFHTNFLFFGRITPYKGLNLLAEAYKQLIYEFNNISLTIVGSGDFSLYSDLFNNLPNFKLINRWIQDEEVGSFFIGKNIITILSYIDATQSGIIPIAMEYKSLVIASNTGGLSEQVSDRHTGFLFHSNDILELYNIMKFAVQNEGKFDKILTSAQESVRLLSWDRLVESLLSVL